LLDVTVVLKKEEEYMQDDLKRSRNKEGCRPADISLHFNYKIALETHKLLIKLAARCNFIPGKKVSLAAGRTK